METPVWIRKAAMKEVLAPLVTGDRDTYLTALFGLQPSSGHIEDLADMLYKIATDTTEES